MRSCSARHNGRDRREILAGGCRRCAPHAGTASGRRHEVLTGICLRNAKPQSAIVTTSVVFAPITDAEIDEYVASGEPMDKAGAYAIQGLASKFVARIEGDYFNVMGLPVALCTDICDKQLHGRSTIPSRGPFTCGGWLYWRFGWRGAGRAGQDRTTPQARSSETGSAEAPISALIPL